MNLETRLNDSLNDILRSSGYMFEIINKNKRQSNMVTGSNNQLIPPVVTAQLGNSIGKFDDILDDTVSKFNDAKWCVEQMLESRQKQAEMKLKEAEERKREEEERKKLEEKKRLEEEKRAEEEKKQEEAKKKESEEKRKQEEKKQQEEKDKQEREKSTQQPTNNNQDLFNDFISPGFDFNINEVMDSTSANNNQNGNSNNDTNNNDNNDIPNPADILSSIDYPDLNFGPTDGINNDSNNNGNNNGTNNDQLNDSGDNKNEIERNDLDLDINNVLGTNDSILDGLNMSLLDQEDEINNQANNNEDFDVDNFLNQFAGND